MSKKIPDFTDSEIRLHAHDRKLTPITSIEEYDEIEDCIISLLRVQADHTQDTQQENESPN